MIGVEGLEPAGPVLKAGNHLIPLHCVAWVDIESIESQIAYIGCLDGTRYTVEGFDAIEVVMQLKPSALEGRRLKWRKNAWAFHNLVAHPLMQIMVWLGYKKAAIRLHDGTTPRPR